MSGQVKELSSSVRNKIEFLNNMNQDFGPTISNPAIKTLKQELKEDFILPSGYNGIAVGLKIPNGVDLVVPSDATLVIL